MKSVCVFCGSSMGRKEIYKTQATLLGKLLAENNIEVVYGGASVGLMGAVADGALEANGQVIGILPEVLKGKEVAHASLSELIVVSDMMKRKELMLERSDLFFALPGGMGTYDEIFEVLTHDQLGLIEKNSFSYKYRRLFRFVYRKLKRRG